MHDDIATTTGNSTKSDSPDIADLGHDVYQTGTKMSRYQGSHRRLADPVEPALLVTHIQLDRAAEAVRQRTLARYAT